MYSNRINLVDKIQEEINSFKPLNKNILKQLREYYRVGLTYTSNALEGNSLTESETKIILEEGITIGGKPIKDHFEVIGAGEAYNLLYNLSKKEYITEEDIKELHYLFYYRIDRNNAGKYRNKPAIITGSDVELPAPSEIPQSMSSFATEIPEYKTKYHPVEFAALLHIKLVNIHPFIDGNGRTARLLMNLALLQAGYVITIIPPVVRSDYIDALKATNKKNNVPFVNLISNMVYESQHDYLRLLRTLTKE